MEGRSLERLVTARAEDGVRLKGLFMRPIESQGAETIVVWIHGGGNSFVSPPYPEIGQSLASRGYAFLSGNTRGHDLGSMQQRDGRSFWGGTLWERLEEAPYDLSGWISFAERAGFSRIFLAGHSLGAVKVTSYQADRQDPRVSGLIVISPPLRPQWSTSAYPDVLAQAEDLVATGHPQELVAWPWGFPISAQTYVSTHRLDLDQFGRENPDPAIGRVRCPILLLIGDAEPEIATAEDLTVARRNAKQAASLDAVMIKGADHVYNGCDAKVAETIATWIKRLA